MTTIFDPNQTPSVSMGYQNSLNILDNAGFDVWQRGTSINLGGGGQYATDRWNYPGVTGGAVTVSKETTITHNSVNSLKFNVTNAGSATIAYLFQNVENYLDYAGRTVSLSCWVNTTMSNVRIALQNGVIQSAAHPGDGQWHQLTVTTTLATNITFLNAFIPIIPTGLTTCIVYVDSAMLVVGSTPIEHVPTHPEVDLARCQRYFQTVGGAVGKVIGVGGIATVGGIFEVRFDLKVTMRAIPSLIVNNGTHFNVTTSGFGQAACTSVGAFALSVDSIALECTTAAGVTVGQACYLISNNTDATLYLSAEN